MSQSVLLQLLKKLMKVVSYGWRWRTVGQGLTTEYQLCVVSLKITKKTTMSLISQNLTEY